MYSDLCFLLNHSDVDVADIYWITPTDKERLQEITLSSMFLDTKFEEKNAKNDGLPDWFQQRLLNELESSIENDEPDENQEPDENESDAIRHGQFVLNSARSRSSAKLEMPVFKRIVCDSLACIAAKAEIRNHRELFKRPRTQWAAVSRAACLRKQSLNFMIVSPPRNHHFKIRPTIAHATSTSEWVDIITSKKFHRCSKRCLHHIHVLILEYAQTTPVFSNIILKEIVSRPAFKY